MLENFSFFASDWENVLDTDRLNLIAEHWKIPCYLFDECKAAENVNALRQCLDGKGKIAYAMKANPWMVESVMDKVDYIEVCSEGELELCARYNVPGQKIVLDGVYKNETVLLKAIKHGVGRITIDSPRQLEKLLQLVNEKEAPEILIRVSNGNQFGMDQKEVMECAKLCGHFNKKISGIQFYPGTQRLSLQQIERELAVLKGWINFCRSLDIWKGKIVEFGSGIAFPYFKGENLERFSEAVSRVSIFIGEIAKEYEVVYESGRIIAASCGVYITKIFEKKERDGKNILLCEGGTCHFNYPGGILGVRTPYLDAIIKKKAGRMENCMICGSLCSEGDVLVRECELDAGIQPGDYLIFHNTGAYSATESPNLFLCMEMAEILVYNRNIDVHGGIREIRKGVPAFPLLDDRI